MAVEFGTPVPVTEMPPGTSGKGGRASNAPGLTAWLNAAAKAGPGTYELASDNETDHAHPIGRLTQIRKIATDMPGIKIESRVITAGKRYRIFATVVDPATVPANGEAKASTPAPAAKAK